MRSTFPVDPMNRAEFMLQKTCLAVVAAVCLAGCSTPAEISTKPLQAIAELPAANLPAAMRLRNWTDARGSGSCVIASSCFNHNWGGNTKRAADWRNRYAGGQTETTIRRKHDAERIPYYFTRSADPEFLRWVTRTRRSALIWYYPRHCVNFVGFHTDPNRPTDPNVYAWLCDNNRPAQFIRVPVSEFVRKWAGYGGFGLALESPPVPPPLFDATDPEA